MGCDDTGPFSAVARDHAIHPRNFGPPEKCDGHARITGPCGDTMEFWLIVQDNIMVEVDFVTDGCGSSLACGSMATCLAQGRDIEDIINLRQQDILRALGGFPRESEHCALLAANTLQAACEDYLLRRRGPSTASDNKSADSATLGLTDQELAS